MWPSAVPSASVWKEGQASQEPAAPGSCLSITAQASQASLQPLATTHTSHHAPGQALFQPCCNRDGLQNACQLPPCHHLRLGLSSGDKPGASPASPRETARNCNRDGLQNPCWLQVCHHLRLELHPKIKASPSPTAFRPHQESLVMPGSPLRLAQDPGLPQALHLLSSPRTLPPVSILLSSLPSPLLPLLSVLIHSLIPRRTSTPGGR